MRARTWAVVGLTLGGCFADGGLVGTTSTTVESTGGVTTGGDATSSESGVTSSSSGTTTEPTTATTEVGSTGSPEGQACDPFAQDCPGGFKCAPYASDGGTEWDANKCVPATGNDLPGQGCSADGGTSGYDTCVKGAFCTNVDDKGTGVCVSLCGGSEQSPTCTPGLACLAGNDGAINLCVQICDPLQPGDCALPGDICVPYGEIFVCVVDGSGGAATDFSPCGNLNGCGDGRFCGAGQLAPIACDGADNCCIPFCSLSTDPSTCPVEMTCLSWYGDARPPPKYADVGLCIEP